MIHRLPVLGAIFAGLVVLAMSLAALFTRLPPHIEDGGFLDMALRSAAERQDFVDPGLLTIVIVVVAMGALTVLFVVEFLTPKASRKASSRRLRAVEDLLKPMEDRAG